MAALWVVEEGGRQHEAKIRKTDTARGTGISGDDHGDAAADGYPPTPDDAEQTVRDWWHNGQIILVPEDFSGVEFEVTERTEGGDGNGRMEEVQR